MTLIVQPIFSSFFVDENFIHHHQSRGTLSFVNAGPHSNFSCFMIEFGAKPYFDRKYVAFGRVVDDGNGVLEDMERVQVVFERPVVPLVVSGCGVWEGGV